jgi:hypothetical protein
MSALEVMTVKKATQKILNKYKCNCPHKNLERPERITRCGETMSGALGDTTPKLQYFSMNRDFLLQ